jgi:acyl-CoA synthetase (AMP-forming)/AMP-acid ligase II
LNPAHSRAHIVASHDGSESYPQGDRRAGFNPSVKRWCLLLCFEKGANGDVDVASELRKNVARALGKALAPRDVLLIGDLPKTRNAKMLRRLIRAAYISEKLGDTSALENPASIEEIKRVAAR